MKKYKGKSVYIAGKISGDRDYKFKFKQAEIKLKSMGFLIVINPCDVKLPYYIKTKREIWTFFMKQNTARMLKCDYVYALPDCEKSVGTCIELRLAKDLGLGIIYEESK